MKVILTQDVEDLGGIGDVVDVAQGYANNFLIPRKLAVAATRGNLKHWDEKRSFIVKREAATRAEAEDLAKQLEGAKIVINAKSGEEGRLYGSVTAKDVTEEIERDLRVEVDRKKISLPEPIKTVGDHEVSIHLYKDVTAKLTVSVVGEGGAGQAPEAAGEAVAEEPASSQEESASEGSSAEEPTEEANEETA